VIFFLCQSQRRLKAWKKEQIGDCHLKIFKVKNHLHAYENRYHLPVQVDFDIGVFVHVSHQPETKEEHSLHFCHSYAKKTLFFFLMYRDGWRFRKMSEVGYSALACYGSSLGSNPDISQNYKMNKEVANTL
jgi:hypothetical protein